MVNLSEGRDTSVVEAVGSTAGDLLLDVHSDGDHHRSVLTLGGPLAGVEEAARRVVAAAVRLLDLSDHVGVHPRLGVADVVPFVPLGGPDPAHGDLDGAVGARDRLARWAGDRLSLPCFLYGPGRTLPEVRRGAFGALSPDTGPDRPHPTAGASAVGARPLLVAYNLWIGGPSGADDGDGVAALAVARSVAAEVRSPALRTLGLAVGPGAQVSCNLVDLDAVRIDGVYDRVATLVEGGGCTVLRAELVGLAPEAAVLPVPRHRWAELDLDAARTIEARLEARGRP